MNLATTPVQAGDALLIVDVQQDFLPGGALAVPAGDAVIAPINRCAALFAQRGLPIFATRDWHPPDHCSFRAQGGPWPPHCVAETPGARLSPALQLPAHAVVISKATAAQRDAYSGFQGTDLAQRLRTAGCRRVYITGLATDYCVKATALDALRDGFAAIVLEDAIRAVEVHAGDGAAALAEMRAAGAQLARVAELAA